MICHFSSRNWEGAKNAFFSDGSDANKLYVLVLNMYIYIYPRRRWQTAKVAKISEIKNTEIEDEHVENQRKGVWRKMTETKSTCWNYSSSSSSSTGMLSPMVVLLASSGSKMNTVSSQQWDWINKMGICVHNVFVIYIYMYLYNYIYYNVCIYIYVCYIYIHIHTQQNGDINVSLYVCIYIYTHVAWGIPPAFLKLLLVICSQEHLSVGFFEKETVETIF